MSALDAIAAQRERARPTLAIVPCPAEDSGAAATLRALRDALAEPIQCVRLTLVRTDRLGLPDYVTVCTTHGWVGPVRGTFETAFRDPCAIAVEQRIACGRVLELLRFGYDAADLGGPR